MTQETTTADDLSDDLFRVAMETTDDGRVNAEITAVRGIGDPNGRYIEVEYRLPSMRTCTERMDYPERDTSEHKFVRLCRAAGYSLASSEQLEGAEVEAEQVDGDWELYVPEQTTWRDTFEHYSMRLTMAGGVVVALLALPVFMLAMMIIDGEPGNELDGYSDMAFLLVMSTGLWAFIMWGLQILMETLITAAPASEVPI